MEVSSVREQSTVTASFATNPMKLLTPRSRGQSVSIFLSNFGGGLVAGDQTYLDLRIGQNARCFVGTQASTKVYRNPRSLPCGHTTHARIAGNGLLVFAPAPVQPFADSNYQQRQQFYLASTAGLALVDWFTSGRSARGERWRFAHFSSRNEVWIDKPQSALSASDDAESPPREPVFLDACWLDQADGPLSAPHRTGRFNCFATLLFVGAALNQAAQRLLQQIGGSEVGQRHSLLVAASATRHGAVLRVAGERVADVERCLHGHMAQLADCLGEDPWSRRS